MSRRRRLFLLGVFGFLLLSACVDYFTSWHLYHHSPYTDELGLRIGRQIESGVPGLAGPSDGARRSGKFYYVYSRSRYHPDLTFYGVTAPDEIVAVETLARKAMAGVPEITGVTLRFFEAEVWHKKNGGSERGEETLLKEITINSHASK